MLDNKQWRSRNEGRGTHTVSPECNKSKLPPVRRRWTPGSSTSPHTDGAHGFIFPWLRFKFTTLIWLRVFVRVSNDLQQRPRCFPCHPVLFSSLLAFFSVAIYMAAHLISRVCRWIKKKRKKISVFFPHHLVFVYREKSADPPPPPLSCHEASVSSADSNSKVWTQKKKKSNPCNNNKRLRWLQKKPRRRGDSVSFCQVQLCVYIHFFSRRNTTGLQKGI